MARLTICLPDRIEAKARKAAKAKGKSIGRWIVDHVAHSLDDTWPKGVLNAAGAFRDFPSLEEIRGGYGQEADGNQSV